MAAIVSIELHNFKSYKGTHIIGPFKRFSAIIGPNGSGKSNSMDAISFVLGLSTQKLRSTRLRDLVYRSQLEDLPPEGRTARVTLNLLLANGQQKVFSREIKSNQSIYVVDGAFVKADEYLAGLATLGVNHKSRNFLVFQGDVEHMSQRDSKELTALIEQLSGSSKLLPEYNSLEAGIAEQQETLRFHTGKKNHLDACLRELAKEKEEAAKYLALQRDLVHKRSTIYTYKLYVNESAAGALRDQISEQESDATQARERLDRDMVRLREMERDFGLAEAALTSAEASRDQLSTQQEAIAGFVSEHAAVAQALKGRLQESETRRKKLKQHIAANHAAVEEADAEVSACEAAVAALNAETLPTSLPKMTKAQQSQFDLCVATARARCGPLSVEVSRMDGAQAMIADDISRADRTIKDLSKQVNVFQKRRTEAENSCLAMEAEVGDIRQQEAALTAEISTLDEAMQQSDVSRERLASQLRDVGARLDNIAADRRELDRINEAKDHIKSLRGEVPGIYGVMSDLYKPTSKQYAKALSSALGYFNDHIICQTFEDGKKAISLIKRHRWPRMSFVALDNITSARSDFRIRELNGCVALDCMTFEEVLRPAFEMALQNTLIVETSEDATNVAYHEARRLRVEVKVVALSGQKVLKNGNLNVDNQGVRRAGLRESAALLKRLQAEQKVLLGEMQERHHAEGQHDSLVEKKVHRTQMHSLIGAKQRRLQFLERDRDHVREELQRASAELKTQEKLKEKLENTSRCNERKILELKSELTTAEAGVFASLSAELQVDDVRRLDRELQEQARKREAQSKQLELKYDRASRRLVKLQEAMAKLECDSAATDVNTMEARLSCTLTEIDEATAQLEKLNTELAVCMKECLRLQRIDRDNTALREKRRQELHQVKADVARTSASLSTLQGRMERLSAEGLDVLRSAVLRGIPIPCRNGVTTADVRRFLNLEDADQEVPEIEFDYDQLPAELLELWTETDASDQYKEMEEGIRSLEVTLSAATPNLRSPDQWIQMKADADDLAAKIKDLTKHRTTLTTRFRQVKEERKGLFLECLDTVKGHLERLYSALSAGTVEADSEGDFRGVGGSATLALDDAAAEEPYLGGVRFHAMPPAKRYRDLKLLSGGEQSMASLAFIFALQAYKPAPFVLLDEVDAALDAKNVRSLGTFFENVQYQVIVISLKDSLYARSDALFGVYKSHEEETSGVLSCPLWLYQKKVDVVQ
ncbi:MAG: uncharacterized protein KVP18_004595 [Porospora cf. gigantea A]|uniref:uncharacterized protein n=1 Tax=Porospora cf. gigantea A TaxID=2853593 RepID=UPI0035598FE6|nr:MAG: hypothetical protein KVP18_004595 [Porospora cf. gigantea A]